MNAMTAIQTKKEKGFTLIELVMVIVILGILAAFALPRFADFGTEARIATLKGAAGSVRSAAAIAHSRWIADGSDGTAGTTVALDGEPSVAMSTSGYPTEAAGIALAAQLSDDFDITGDLVSVTNAAGKLYSDCRFTYDDSTGKVEIATGEDVCKTIIP